TNWTIFSSSSTTRIVFTSAILCKKLRRSGDSASFEREGKSDLCRSRLTRGRRRNRSVRPVVPCLQGRLDERRQRKGLLRSTGTAVPVAAKAAPGPAAVPAAHHLAHRVAAPAALAPEHRQAEAQPAQHHQFPVPVFRRVIAHLVSLLNSGLRRGKGRVSIGDASHPALHL